MQLESIATTPAVNRRAAISMRIELATLQLGAANGLENVTVEQIAEAAGISRRTFYRYFDTIDDILCEMPRRSLRRMSDALAARPPSETLIEALVNMTHDLNKTKEEDHIQRLGFQVAQRSPNIWFRAMSRVQGSTNETYQNMIADRLGTSGGNPAHAPLLTAVMMALIHFVLRQNADSKARKGLDPKELAQALESLAEVIQGIGHR
jgi:AcrR family transcriptional regulator